MSQLKSDLVWDKLNERLAQVDRNKRTFTAILFLHLRQNGKVVRSVVLDFDALKIEEIETGVACTDTYPPGRIQAKISIDDDDFYSLVMKDTSFAALIDQNKITVDGDKQVLLTLDEKFRKK
ncbi:uncharacterized protein LOC129739020 [Uranotaenia lowii]|uniref:uncharacterized protein LOC129739020 n=1 Tax=Uranotaenia lowii TaxID=190385 RepID=UPI0024787370|nr:uncharacterized protein LOC129739020 [Uranotaenia lowii]